jgi:hypothetical protein
MKPMALRPTDSFRFTSPLGRGSGNTIDPVSGESGKQLASAPNGEKTQLINRGLRNWDAQLNEDLTNAQRALNFLDESATYLQSLKLVLSAKLTGQQQQYDAPEHTLRQFESVWQKLQSATGGHLNSQLAYHSGPARQEFTIRGMNMQSLRNGAKETLMFYLGAGQPLRSMIVEPGLSDDALVQRLGEALAPAQIRVSNNAYGSLVFSVAASSWEALCDTMAIKGDGIRFPTGQFNKVNIDIDQPNVQPNSWKVDDAEAIRTTLQHIAQALNQIRHAREVVSRALREAMSRVQALQPTQSATTNEMVQDFMALATQSDYHAFTSMMAAVLGISRSRVLSLLSLKS